MPASRTDTRLLWVTNIAPPYRIAVWRELGKLCDLTVALYATTEPGRHWQPPEADTYTITVLPTLRVSRGEAHIYTLKPRAKLWQTPPNAVIVGGWESPASWSIMSRARRAGATTIAFTESTLLSHTHTNGIATSVRRRFFERADQILTPGIAATEAVQAHGIASERITTLLNCVDNDEWRIVPSLRAQFPRTGHGFIYMGQLIPRKNVTALIQAFAQMSAPDDYLVIAGDGPERAALESLARTVNRRIEFLGHVDHRDLPAAYARAETLVLPSLQEVWGLVANEALAAGMHVVISDQCGAAPSLAGMKGVYVVDPSPDSFGAAMLRSRQDWRQPILEPDILAYGPSRFAKEIDRICRGLLSGGSVVASSRSPQAVRRPTGISSRRQT